MRIILNVVFLLFSFSMYGQTIRIDGNFDDWADIDPVFVDDLNDGQSNGIDRTRIFLLYSHTCVSVAGTATDHHHHTRTQ